MTFPTVARSHADHAAAMVVWHRSLAQPRSLARRPGAPTVDDLCWNCVAQRDVAEKLRDEAIRQCEVATEMRRKAARMRRSARSALDSIRRALPL